jgi:hypothetical protein
MLTELIRAECLTEAFNPRSNCKPAAPNLETNEIDAIAPANMSNFMQFARSKFAGWQQLPVSLGDEADEDRQRPG